MCKIFPIHFHFIAGFENPADHISRPVSYKQLIKTNYFKGPKFLSGKEGSLEHSNMEVIVPNPVDNSVEERVSSHLENVTVEAQAMITGVKHGRREHLIPLNKYSSFHHLASVYKCVLRFVHNLKERLKNKTNPHNLSDSPKSISIQMPVTKL